jgi:hypothetical protein
MSIRYEYRGDRLILDGATAIFTVLIALLGAVMMTMTSSPLVKGASFMWLPGALQLMAGVWLGPWRGFIAAGVGAQAAGVLAYGGWSLQDWIMNLVAGGFANAMLPAYLFRLFRIDPQFGAAPAAIWRATLMLLGLTAAVLAVAVVQFLYGQQLGLTGWKGYILPIVLVLALPFVWRSMTLNVRGFTTGIVIAVFISFISAAIGVAGAVVGGQTLQAAIIVTGTGWFWGDTASAILGLYMLAQFTERARRAGIAPTIIKESPVQDLPAAKG